MRSPLQRMLWLWGGLLGVLLCLLFLPLTPFARGIGIAVAIIVTIIGLVWPRHSPVTPAHAFFGLPEEAYRLPVVLVCGDTPDWPDEAPIYLTQQGCWLRVADSRELRNIARDLLWQRPGWVEQLAVMISIAPSLHVDETSLAAELHELRWQITRLRRAVRRPIPLLLAGRMSGAMVNEVVWQTALAGEPVRVWQEGVAPCLVTSWTAQDSRGVRLQQQVTGNVFADWLITHVVSAFTCESPEVAAVLPCAVLCQQAQHLPAAQENSLWQRYLTRHTALQQVAGWQSAGAVAGPALLPDFLLPQLPKGTGITPRHRAVQQALVLFTLAAAIALLSCAWNNRQLTHRVAFDIHHYYAIPVTDYTLKAKAVTTLRKDAELLNGWSRNGEPLRLGLGLFRGESLRQPLLAAMATYVPPPPPPAPAQRPKIIRLDSMSLFDVGQWVLKPGSTKLLVNSLVGIKGRPGWLIVVAGHTDDTGNDHSNQLLSFKRAEAVRDWMRDTGDVPESCFAVQGYGETRPLKSNDTEAGRSANRRVEISLVPQAEVCQAKGVTASSAMDGVIPQKMEK